MWNKYAVTYYNENSFQNAITNYIFLNIRNNTVASRHAKSHQKPPKSSLMTASGIMSVV